MSEVGMAMNIPPSDLNQPLHFVSSDLAMNVTSIMLGKKTFLDSCEKKKEEEEK